MLVRHNANIDTDEMERARGAMKMQLAHEDDREDAAVYKGGIIALDVLLNYRAKDYRDFLVLFERLAFDRCTGVADAQ